MGGNSSKIYKEMRKMQRPFWKTVFGINDGCIDSEYHDLDRFFDDMVSKMDEKEYTQELMVAFKVLDKDGDGLICASELRYMMTKLGERLTDVEVQQMVHLADADGDGLVNFAEFERLMCRNSE